MRKTSMLATLGLAAVALAACGLDYPVPAQTAAGGAVAAARASVAASVATEWTGRLAERLAEPWTPPSALPTRPPTRVACAEPADGEETGLALPSGRVSLAARVVLALLGRSPAPRVRVPCD